MKKSKISKVKFGEHLTELKTVNEIFFNLIKPIAANYFSQSKDFLYEIGYDFGAPLIQDGKMVLDQIDETEFIDQYKDYTKSAATKTTELLKEFKDCVCQTKGHPLSIVTKNYIEIYRKQQSTHHIKEHSEREEYCYPLNNIAEGELFGVWESINLIYNEPVEPMGWNAVAGKKCILTLLPVPKEHKAIKHYRQGFKKIFNAFNYTDGFNNIAREVLEGKPFTKIIIIPEFYFVIDEKADSPELKQQKMLFREFIFHKGWKQVEDRRSIQNNEQMIIKHFDIKADDLSFLLPTINHIYSIVQGKNFILKPISQSDEFLFEVVKKIIEKFQDKINATYHDYKLEKDLTFLEYNTPLFFHYERLNKEPFWGFEMMHSPSIDIILPRHTLDKVKKLIRENLIDQDQLIEFFKAKKMNVNFKFYVHNTDSMAKHGNSVDDFVQGPIGDNVRGILPENIHVKVSSWPWFFNSLLYMEIGSP